MRIIKPFFVIESPVNGEEILKHIEKCGRTAYKSEDKITESSAKSFIEMLINRGHESVLEHHSISVRIICDRGVSHEIVRHRIASYTQESTRYCNYSKDDHITFIEPVWFDDDLLQSVFHNDMDVYATCYDEPGINIWIEIMWNVEKTYNYLINDFNWTPQQARSVLPNSLKTEIIMTCNLREWRHFFKLRTSEAAHPQMREIAIPLLKEFQKQIPIIFDNL